MCGRSPAARISHRPAGDHYDGIRHVLFVVPMLAILAGVGWVAILPLLRRAPIVAAVAAGAYVGSLVLTLAVLHPLEYVAMNALAGGTRGAYDRFEQDYWSAAATRPCAISSAVSITSSQVGPPKRRPAS
jgi:hypothetical protein